MHGGNYPDKQLRLFRRGHGRFPERHVHERLEVDGAVGDLVHPFVHLAGAQAGDAAAQTDVVVARGRGIDPEVQVINTFSGDEADTVYHFNTAQRKWEAFMPSLQS